MQMNWLIWTIVGVALVLIVAVALWIHRIWKFAKTIGFIIPALIEFKPFMALVNLLEGVSHAMVRHSPMANTQLQKRRAKTGLTPDGIKGRPVHSGRWISHVPMLHAIEICNELWQKESKKVKKAYTVKFNKTIGEVVLEGTKTIIPTTLAKIIINKQGNVITAFPALEEPENINYPIHLQWEEE